MINETEKCEVLWVEWVQWDLTMGETEAGEEMRDREM